jgi:feruloyl esterase
MHGSVAAAKKIIEAYYRDTISFSYYSSCSNGGRQGLKEIQLYPDTFDGIVIGAPGWHPTHLSGWITRQALLNSGASSARVENDLLGTAVEEMIAQCDPQDGVADGIISDPFGCNFDFNQLLCGSGKRSPCLTADQIRTVELLYGDYWGTNQSLVFSGLSLGADASVLAKEPTGLGTSPFRYFVHNNSNWDEKSLSYEDILKADEINPGQSRADNFNLEPFYKRGGKLIMYHGLNDMLIPASGSIDLYNSIYRTLTARNINISDFLRFYLVPGMDHCFGGPVAPWYFGAGFQDLKGATHSVPGFENSEHDITLQIMSWVEKGIEPMELIATKYKQDTVGEVERQRPVCMYPAQARYTGGDVNAARNWNCE